MNKTPFFQKIINLFVGRIRYFVNDGTAIIRSPPLFLTRIAVNRGAYLSIGENSSIQPFSVINVGEKMIIGNDVMIAPHCFIADFQHDFRLVGKERAKSVVAENCVIDDGAWIGDGCVIISSRVGKNSVVGANSTMVKFIVPDNYIFKGDSRGEYKLEKIRKKQDI